MTRRELERRLHTLWYGDSRLYRLLLPLSWLFCSLAILRRAAYRSALLRSETLGCPVIVVGNLAAGGGGKTPLVMALAKCLEQAGLRVGLLCRGYRGRARRWPQRVDNDSDPLEVGDEAVLLAQRTGLPVMAGAERVTAGRALLQQTDCDVLVCDDGLQHYALKRDVEIAVIDPERFLGNGACLPAGPLREPATRLQQVDAVVALGDGPAAVPATMMPVSIGRAWRLDDPEQQRPLDDFTRRPVHAVAGIAYPQRFFRQLREAGLRVEAHAFDDHHPFKPGDLDFDDGHPVLMTEKDAVKCRSFARPTWWAVPLDIRLDAPFSDWLVNAVSKQEY